MTTTLDPLPIETTAGNYFISNYPPYSVWSAEHMPHLMHALARPPKPGPLGLYVHIPFCRHRCHYCYFRVYPRRSRADVDLYSAALLKELDLYRGYPGVQGRPLTSVYFGGGSPSYLEPDQIRALFAGLRERADWSAVEECTVECEPGSLTPEKLKALKEVGVTRLSLGYQTLDEEILRKTGRDTCAGDCLRAFHQAREAGFTELNIDLLAGLPGETTKSWRRTVERVLDLQPDCLTVYQLELTYNSHLYTSMKAGRGVSLPSWPAKRHWTELAFRMAEEAGYEVCSGYMAIRHPHWWRFVHTVELYWHGHDLLALGETAFGHLQGVHYQNVDTFEGYIGALGKDKLPLRRAHLLSAEEKLRREVILQLKVGVLEAAYFREKFGVDLHEHFREQFEELRAEGLLQSEGDTLRLTRRGLLEVDWLLPRFYLPEHVGIRYT
jgi:oxygen-independent coproporphyrinogen-3 oxidase